MTKLGAHVAAARRNGLGELFEAGLACVVMVDQNVIADAKRAKAFSAFRTQRSKIGADNPPNLLQNPDVAEAWMKSLQPIWQMNAGADCYIVNNELDIGLLTDATALNIFYLRCMQIADNWNLKIGICSFSTGCPSDDGALTLEQRWTPMLPAIKYASEHGHVVVLHAHSLNQSLIETGEDIALRHQRSLRFFAKHGYRPRVLIGELSNGVGGVEPNLVGYLDNIVWWDTQVATSEWREQVIGGALYGFNEAETITPAVPRLAQWISQQHPVPPPPPIEPPAPPIVPPSTVRKFKVNAMRVIVCERPVKGREKGKVSKGTILTILETSPEWWGRIEQPLTGWIDLTLCEEI